MKFILFVLFALPFASVFSQDMQLKISAGNDTINVSLDDDNDNKVITIKPQPASGNYLTVQVINEEADKDWKRSFSIYDAEDNAIKDFTLMKNGSYCIKLKDLVPVLKQDKDYFIYTTAVPKDPKKAMLVKVARRLVCKIKLAG